MKHGKNDLNVLLDQFRAKERGRQAAWEEKRRRDLIEARTGNYAREEAMTYLRQACQADYHAWLKGFLLAGGNPTHEYDYPFKRWQFHVALGSFRLGPMFGSDAMQIIVPVGVSIEFGDLGHNNIYTMNDFSHKGFIVPIFSDTVLD